MKAADYVSHLNLQAHPEGGYFAETFRSELVMEPSGFPGPRAASTAIYFLLEQGQFSALHRIKSDEVWHFYDGQSLDIIEIEHNGELRITKLGRNFSSGECLTHVVKAGVWFGSRPSQGTEFSLVGCTVAPGFDFADFEMPSKGWFQEAFPQHAGLISGMSRD